MARSATSARDSRRSRRAAGRPPASQVPVAPSPWVLYILECRDGSLYTGVTTDLDRRLTQHQAGTAARYTRTRRPVRVVYHEPCPDRSAALRRECAVKRLPRAAKLALIGRWGRGGAGGPATS